MAPKALCRLCAGQCFKYFSFFDHSTEKSNLLDKIEQCLQIEVTFSDELPKVVCHECYLKVETFHAYFNSCHEAQTTLIEMCKKKKSDADVLAQFSLAVNEPEMYVLEEFKLDEKNQIEYDDVKCLFVGNEGPKSEGVVEMEERDENPEEEVKREDPHSQGLYQIKMEEELNLGVDVGGTEDGDSLQSEGTRPFAEMLTGLSLSAFPSATPGKLAVYPDLKRHSEEKSTTVPCLELLPKSEGVELCQSTVEEVSTAFPELTSKRYNCDVCPARFTLPSQLKTHKRFHSMGKPYSCDICTARFTRLDHLKAHQKIHTKEKLYTCDGCQIRFTRLDCLIKHQRIHKKEKPYACDVCSARFSDSGNLKKHQRTHSKERPYACDVCQSRFIRLYHLKVHQRIHTKEKPYACDVCSARFTDSGNLTKHLRTHTKEKPYTCDVCTAKFSLFHHLQRHHRSHTNERPYTCDVCSVRFARLDILKKHHKSRHE